MIGGADAVRIDQQRGRRSVGMWYTIVSTIATRYSSTTDEVVDGIGLVHPEQRRDGERDARQAGAEEGHHEPWCRRRGVDRLHGGDALARWQTTEGLHHEHREGEEDTTDDAAADGGHVVSAVRDRST